MTTLVTRAGKGSPLTNTEMDGNLTGLIANNSGATEPITMYAYQWWADTTTGILKQRNAANSAWVNVLTMATGAPLGGATTEQGITQFYYPANGSGYQDLYRSGWLPSWFNQQWGGAQWGTLPDGSFGSVATGNVQDDSTAPVGDTTAVGFYRSAAFQVSESFTPIVIWVKLYKVLNPVDNFQVQVYSNSGGLPSGALGSAGTLSGKLVTSKPDGEWYAITGSYPALTAGTQYHLVFSKSGGADAANYYSVKRTAASKYPFGSAAYATNVPAWSSLVGYQHCFLIQNPAANSLIQSGGQFDYKLSFAAGSPVNQSRSVAQPLANFYDGKICSVLHRGTYAVSTNVWDFSYGIDHDRITLTINSSGYPVLTIYESDRTVATVTGTGSVTSGSHDVGIRVRTVGDGSDYATLYVDGASVGTPLTSQTFTMDVNMGLLGTARLGDGFGLAPTWTQDMQMTSLPSAQGWTWTGTGTEANCMSIQNNKLYQNATGYTSTQTGYYAKTTAFVNGTGWAVEWKCRVPSSTNTANLQPNSIVMTVIDGTRFAQVNLQEYFLTLGDGASIYFTYQGDFKTQEHVFLLQGKGTDMYLFIDGKLAIDGTGKMLNTNASNTIQFGDANATASENSDVIYSYVKYYQGGMLLPTANTGTCSEFAHWSGDKSSLYSSLWNSGSPVSVKQLCGVPRNYQFEPAVQREVRRGVTNNPTTASASYAVLPEIEAYSIGSLLGTSFDGSSTNSSAAGYSNYVLTIDGAFNGTSATPQSAASATKTFACTDKTGVPLGLHKIEVKWNTGAGTETSNGAIYGRHAVFESRS